MNELDGKTDQSTDCVGRSPDQNVGLETIEADVAVSVIRSGTIVCSHDPVDELAIALHASSERHDPSEEEFWEEMPDRRQYFYRYCIVDLLSHLRRFGVDIQIT